MKILLYGWPCIVSEFNLIKSSIQNCKPLNPTGADGGFRLTFILHSHTFAVSWHAVTGEIIIVTVYLALRSIYLNKKLRC